MVKEARLTAKVVGITKCSDNDCSPWHESVTFEISGISRACANQLVRHRVASYSQESMRYVDMSDLRVVIPPELDGEKKDLLLSGYEAGLNIYRALRTNGVRKEDARFVLGLGVATRIVVTMQLPMLKRFWQLRSDKAAQWEIRNLAEKMLLLASEFFPEYLERESSEVVKREFRKNGGKLPKLY